ncbi:TetR family transcriptional regulator [Streptomyces dioscori]|uniref:TetR family transcriptional regulator n=1 Tax=Streptomyces dioscori TaxID=2109333 RepID=A0A2P8PYL8_9ACTN|nr:TetR/AcrR family transcriptional regulator [Streptomyces dioscori]PSM39075.1 TetR family transcriptional regulator [Streptomyces dioscori]
MTSPRPLRADAARNRKLLLAAAADEFDVRGLDVSVADIARRAGVGKGTVFRHFATKDDLVAAIVLDRITALTETGGELLTAADAGAALLEFLSAVAREMQHFDLMHLQRAAEFDPELSQAQERLFRHVHALVERARSSGAVRTDITGADVVALMCAPKHAASSLPDAPPDLWQRYLAIIFDGLRPAGAHPLPQPPPSSP